MMDNMGNSNIVIKLSNITIGVAEKDSLVFTMIELKCRKNEIKLLLFFDIYV